MNEAQVILEKSCMANGIAYLMSTKSRDAVKAGIAFGTGKISLDSLQLASDEAQEALSEAQEALLGDMEENTEAKYFAAVVAAKATYYIHFSSKERLIQELVGHAKLVEVALEYDLNYRILRFKEYLGV